VPAITGQTNGPNMLIFFEWTLAHTGGNEGLKSSFKKTKVFKNFFFIPRATPGTSTI